jgi:acyl carrier protein
VPIGRPIDNITMYVVDSRGRPQPVGVEGDLLIGGVGLARGYANADALTAERFIPDHLGVVSEGRLYRTGDRALWTSSGVLEFRGRTDHQVKLRGLRIELGEIEHAIITLGLARQAAVAVCGDGESGFLAAYLVGADGINDATFRSRLGDRLPDYMVPGVVMRIDALPVSGNGKLRRDALPPPTVAAEPQDEEFTEIEAAVAQVWEDVTGARPSTRETNFFALGGNSMALLRVSTALRERLGVSVPLSTLLSQPFLNGVAAAVEDLRRLPRPGTALAERQSDVEAPASPSQRRMWTAEAIEGGGYTYNVPVALRLSGPVHVARLADALDRLQSRHQMLRACLQDGPHGLVVRVSDMLRFPLLIEDRLRDRSAAEWVTRLSQVRHAHATQRFPLESGPLAAATLIRLTDVDHELLLCFHHTVVDAESLDVICRDLASYYAGVGTRAPMSPDYLDYCRADGGTLSRALAWWRAQFAGSLRFGLPRTGNNLGERRFGTHEFTVGRHLTRGANLVAMGHGASLFTFCLAAWFLALAAESDSRPIVAVQVSGRPPEHHSTVGPFINQVPVLAPAADPGDAAGYFAEVVTRWRAVASHADVPFDEIVAACGVGIDADGTAFSQVGFNFTSPVACPAAWGDVTVSLVDTPSPGQAKAPVFVEIEEHVDGLRGVVEYRADMHDAAQIARLHASWDLAFRRLIMAGVAGGGH